MEHLIESLSNAGLTDKEARVYLALLQLNQASAYAVAERSGLKKPTTYVILDELIKKGLASRVPRMKKHHYIAKPPDEFLAMTEARVGLIKKALPEMQALINLKEWSTRTLFFEGMAGMEQAIFYKIDELNGTENMGFFASGEKTTNEYLVLANKWLDEIFERKIILKGLLPDTEFTRDLKKKYPAASTLQSVPSEKYSLQVSIDITPLFVRIVDGYALQAVIFENPRVASALKQIFELTTAALKP